MIQLKKKNANTMTPVQVDENAKVPKTFDL